MSQCDESAHTRCSVGFSQRDPTSRCWLKSSLLTFAASKHSWGERRMNSSYSKTTLQAACRLMGVGIVIVLGLGANGKPVADEGSQLIDVWNGMPPGETVLSVGETLPRRATEDPPATRVGKITRPQLEMFEPPADKRSGMAIVILPGGGY